MTWRRRALCRVIVRAGAAIVDEWFPGAAGETGRGKRATPPKSETRAVCVACPVRLDCLEEAIRNDEHHGVWGGVNFASPAERDDALAARRHRRVA